MVVAVSKTGDSTSDVTEPLVKKEHPGSKGSLIAKLRDKWKLALYTVGLLFFAIGNTVYFKCMTSAMPNYGWYLTQISSVVYLPIFVVGAGCNALCQAKRPLLQKFLVMGICDGLSGIFMVLGGVHTSGNMQVLLFQVAIPFTMAFSIMLIGKRFHLLQTAGAMIIILGIVLTKAGNKGSDDSNDLLIFNFIFILSLMPNAFSSVYKEIAFRGFDGDLDVNVLQFWVAGFQICTNFLAMPIYSLSILGAQQVPLAQMPELITGGTKCLFFGENQIVDQCGLPGLKPCDTCQDGWISVGRYLFFNFGYNVTTMLVIKHGSATLVFLASTLRMPLSSLAFASTWIMGADAVNPGPTDVLSLFVILAGLGAYRYGGRLLKRQQRRPSQTTENVTSPAWPSPSESPSDMVPSPSDQPSSGKTNRNGKFAALFSTGMPAMQPVFVYVPQSKPQPRSSQRVRNDLIHRLGAASPLHSPELRSLKSPELRNLSPDCSPPSSPHRSKPPKDAFEATSGSGLFLPPAADPVEKPEVPSWRMGATHKATDGKPDWTRERNESDFSLKGMPTP